MIAYLDKKNRMKRHGTVLVLVLLVIVILSLAALTFSKLMFAENRAAVYSQRRRQARMLAESGVESLRITLMKEPEELYDLGGLYDNEDLFCGYIVTDGTIAMTGPTTGEESTSRGSYDLRDVGRFSVIAPALDDDGGFYGELIRYGLEDESTKFNLRWLIQTETQMPGYGRTLLLRLPGMTEEIADALLDYLDEDDEVRDYGAESEYYEGLDPPYYPRNGMPDSLDELLLVRGITPALLYGLDWNRNGLLDLGEPDESTLEDELDVDDGSLNLGLIAYLTLDSRESHINPTTGEPKVNLNMEDTSALREALEEVLDDEEWIDFIVAYRESNEKINSILDLVGSTAGNAENTEDAADAADALSGQAGQTGQGGSSGQGGQVVQAGSGGSDATLESPLSTDDFDSMNETLPLLYDALSISDKPVVGRININQASRQVLMVLAMTDDEAEENAAQATESMAAGESEDGDGTGSTGGSTSGLDSDSTSALRDSASASSTSGTSAQALMTEEIVEGILENREADPSLMDNTPEMRYPFWPYTHGIVEDFDTMKKLEPYFCTQGAVFRAQVVGRFDEQSPAARIEVWLDATDPMKPAKIIRQRELTDLGGGFSPEDLGVETFQNSRSGSNSRRSGSGR